MDPNNPREAWSRIQSAIARAQQQGGGRGRPPKGVLGGGAALLLLGAAALTFNSAIFNGM
jgi:prohibitin 2